MLNFCHLHGLAVPPKLCSHEAVLSEARPIVMQQPSPIKVRVQVSPLEGSNLQSPSTLLSVSTSLSYAFVQLRDVEVSITIGSAKSACSSPTSRRCHSRTGGQSTNTPPASVPQQHLAAGAHKALLTLHPASFLRGHPAEYTIILQKHEHHGWFEKR